MGDWSGRRSAGSREASGPGESISFAPALRDGVDCPWTRGRRTRWWLVLPADALAVSLVALFGAASVGPLDAVMLPLWQGLAGVVPGWVVAWAVRRRSLDHLEMAVPEGLVVIGVTWVAWTVLHVLSAAPVPIGEHASWTVMTGTFLLFFLGGWRWLYGYVRAHDCLVPSALARRIAAQEADSRND